METSDNPLEEWPVLADNVRASTEAEAQVHLIASGFLLQRLCWHERTRELFNAWTHLLNLHKPVSELRAATGHLKALEESNASAIQIKAAEDEVNLLRQQLEQAMLNVNPIVTLQLVAHYLDNELRLPWRWLLEGLRKSWVAYMWGYANMESGRWTYALEVIKPPVPSMEDFHFKDIPGEKASERFARFRRETKAFLKKQEAAYKAMQQKKGKASTKHDVERYVDWYFRNKVEGEASELIGLADGFEASYVRERIREVHAWLDRGK